MKWLIPGLLALAGAAAAQSADEVVEQLREAYKSNDETSIEPAIHAAGKVEDQKVVREIARGLKYPSVAVKKAAIETLGAMKSEAALDALHRAYRGGVYKKEPMLFAALLKAIGRHGDPDSIDVLVDSPFRNLTLESGRARLLGLANIRDDKSVEALIELSRKAGGKQRGSGISSSWRGVFNEDFHAAIVILTGEDYGRGRDDLEKWWREWRKKDAPRVPAKKPKVDPEISNRFESYWNETYYEDPSRKPPPATLQPPIEIVADPSKKQVDEALARFKEAFDARDPDLLANVVERVGGVNDDRVIHQLARALRIHDDAVRTHAVIALGWLPSPNALRQLHRMYRREKDLGEENEALFAELLKSIGRHGDRRSIDVLSDKPFRHHTLESSRARIYGLGNIRHRQSVEELMRGLQLTGSAGARGPRAFRTNEPRAMPEFNVALAVLTGVEIGASQDAWLAWWRENKRSLKVSPSRPPVSEDVRRTWERYWNEPY